MIIDKLFQNRGGVALLLLLLLSFSAPALAQEEAAEPDLVFGSLPVSHMFPFYVALSQGYFEEEGVSVNLMAFTNARALREAVIAGEVEGFQSDLVSALLINDAGRDARVVRHLEITDYPFFAILTGGPNAVTSVEELSGRQIAISMNTVVEYITDQLLAGVGVSRDEVEYLDVPSIIDRGLSYMAGELDLITLPQPYIQLGLGIGGSILLDDSVVDYVPESIGFATETLTEKGDAVRAFLRAYERAIHDYNNAEEGVTLREMIDEATRAQLYGNFAAGFASVEAASPAALPGMLDAIMAFTPTYLQASVASEEQYAAVHDWALEKGLISEARAYDEVIDGRFLPEMMADGDASDGDMADDGDASDGDDE